MKTARKETNVIKYGWMLCLCILLAACKEDKPELYDATQTSLNIAKGTVFGDKEDYPESYSFNAYFLGGKVSEYEIRIPVRLSGVVDTERDRPYRVRVNETLSQNVVKDLHYSLDEQQVFRKGLYQDSIRLTVHVDALDEQSNYTLCVELMPNAEFAAGVPDYRNVLISFTKNLSITPAFWENNSKLAKLTYSPRKCAVFLEISGITSPDWIDDGSTIQLDYWINLCTQYFKEHEEYDENGNRIYFDE